MQAREVAPSALHKSVSKRYGVRATVLRLQPATLFPTGNDVVPRTWLIQPQRIHQH
jgi:hypothetical protein